MPSNSAPITHQKARVAGAVWVCSIAPTACRICTRPSRSSRRKRSRPRSNWLRAARSARERSSGDSAAAAALPPGGRRVRSGKNSSDGATTLSPRAAMRSRYSGISRIGWSAPPATSSSRWLRTAEIARCATGPAWLSVSLSLPACQSANSCSSASQKWVRPSRPTMASAPRAWCRWVCANFSASAPAACRPSPSASAARTRARSISPRTQISGPRSCSLEEVLIP